MAVALHSLFRRLTGGFAISQNYLRLHLPRNYKIYQWNSRSSNSIQKSECTPDLLVLSQARASQTECLSPPLSAQSADHSQVGNALDTQQLSLLEKLDTKEQTASHGRPALPQSVSDPSMAPGENDSVYHSKTALNWVQASRRSNEFDFR